MKCGLPISFYNVSHALPTGLQKYEDYIVTDENTKHLHVPSPPDKTPSFNK